MAPFEEASQWEYPGLASTEVTHWLIFPPTLAEQMQADESFTAGTEEGFRQIERGEYRRLEDVKREMGDDEPVR